ncbi:hypothetical protein OG799_08605 [Micromonospora sp. NBC_00898]|uniref:hypothetical protein n=1 Tax=Micromonospora sp. NBC_00898 TaxID=2975981 RepID=UPI00386B7EDD|nr:hypothetical protein OG799_08605 [Micromonospora sp. NBC_00898]
MVFLLSAITFAVAHRPRLVSVPVGEFGPVWARTLRRLDRLITLGSALFIAATAGSLAVFAALLWPRTRQIRAQVSVRVANLRADLA